MHPPIPDRRQFLSRLEKVGLEACIPFTGTVYRFISPRFSKPEDIVSGKGGMFCAGRWNPKGVFPIGYTSLTPETALAEVLAHARYFNLPLGNQLPKVLVSLRANLPVLDLGNGALRRRLRLGAETIRSHDWRRENQEGREALTQAWGWAFQEAGFGAVLVPSSQDPTGTNLLTFPGILSMGRQLEVENEVEWPC